jgi:hypothetical protein
MPCMQMARKGAKEKSIRFFEKNFGNKKQK